MYNLYFSLMKTMSYLKLPKDELNVHKVDSTFGSGYYVLQISSLSAKEILQVAETAYHIGKKLILNSLPDKKIRRKLLRYISIAILSERQISELTKVDIKDLGSAKIAALKLYGRGAETVIIKMETGKVLVFANEVFSLVRSLEQSFNIVANEKEFVELIDLI